MDKDKAKKVATVGLGGVTGAAVGGAAVFGSQQANAAETEPEVPAEEVKEEDSSDQPEVHTVHHYHHVVQNDDQPLEVLGVATVNTDMGPVDVAVLKHGDTEGVVMDMNQDGEGDILWVDQNHNFQAESNEIHFVSGPNYNMNTYAQAVGSDSNSLASNDHSMGDGSDVSVIATGTVHTEVGDVDMAVVTDGSTMGAVVDLDQNNQADLLMVDENHNDNFDANEVYDIQSNDVSMTDLGMGDDSLISLNE